VGRVNFKLGSVNIIHDLLVPVTRVNTKRLGSYPLPGRLL